MRDTDRQTDRQTRFKTEKAGETLAMAMAKTQVQAQSQAQATMKVDPEEMIEIAEEMARVMEEKWHEERGILDDLDADLFSTILACKEDHVELITIIEGALSLSPPAFICLLFFPVSVTHMRDRERRNGRCLWFLPVLQEQIAVIERSLQESSDNGHSSTSRIELVKQRDNLLLRERLLKEEER